VTAHAPERAAALVMEGAPMTCLALVLASACGALPNPEPATVPARYEPPPARPAPVQEPVSAAAPAPAPAPTPATVLPRTPDSGVAVAYVGGQPIDVGELLSQWLHQDSLQVLEQLDHLVLGRLVVAEAGRLSVVADPARVEAAYRDAVAQIEKRIQVRRPGVTFDRYVDEALGLDPVRYREFLRDEALRGLLAERVVRAWVLASEHTLARVIVVKSDEDSGKVRAALDAGEPFEEVARRLSADGSAKDGGRVPPIVRSETVMGRLAFGTEIGKVGGPQYEKGAWLYLLVEARPEPLEGAWPAIAEAVEKSLAERPVAELEVSQWKPAMAERYQVDVTPLLRLAGQPTR